MLYAAYGSNLHPTRLRQRVSSARFISVKSLPGYRLSFHKRSHADGSGKCMLAPASQSVLLAIYEIAANDLVVLDRIEGAGNGYDRVKIPVDGIGDCETYQACESHVDASLKPFGWYQELVVRGCEAIGLPDSYTQAIRGVASRVDPVPARAVRYRLLLQSLSSAPIQVSRSSV